MQYTNKNVHIFISILLYCLLVNDYNTVISVKFKKDAQKELPP